MKYSTMSIFVDGKLRVKKATQEGYVYLYVTGFHEKGILHTN